MRTSRKVSANTHFEEWWFKTFFYSTAKAAYIIPTLIQASFLQETGLLCIKRNSYGCVMPQQRMAPYFSILNPIYINVPVSITAADLLQPFLYVIPMIRQ
jgi:hypothetical protein